MRWDCLDGKRLSARALHPWWNAPHGAHVRTHIPTPCPPISPFVPVTHCHPDSLSPVAQWRRNGRHHGPHIHSLQHPQQPQHRQQPLGCVHNHLQGTHTQQVKRWNVRGLQSGPCASLVARTHQLCACTPGGRRRRCVLVAVQAAVCGALTRCSSLWLPPNRTLTSRPRPGRPALAQPAKRTAARLHGPRSRERTFLVVLRFASTRSACVHIHTHTHIVTPASFGRAFDSLQAHKHARLRQRAGIRELGVLGKRRLARPGCGAWTHTGASLGQAEWPPMGVQAFRGCDYLGRNATIGQVGGCW